MSVEVTDQMFDGSAFQMVGAATEKWSTVCNCLNHARIFEKQFRWSKCPSRYALWYEICNVFKRHSLEAFESKQCDFFYVIQWQIGRQCKSWRIGLYVGNLLVHVTSLTAEFLTHCIFIISFIGSPYNRILHESSLDETNACTSRLMELWSRFLDSCPIL